MGKLIDWTFHLASVRPSCSGWPPLSEYGRIPGHSLPRNHSWRFQPVRATSLHSAQTRKNDSLFYLPKVYLCYSLLKNKIKIPLRFVEASFCRMCCVEKKLYFCVFFLYCNNFLTQSYCKAPNVFLREYVGDFNDWAFRVVVLRAAPFSPTVSFPCLL